MYKEHHKNYKKYVLNRTFLTLDSCLAHIKILRNAIFLNGRVSVHQSVIIVGVLQLE